MTRLRLRIGPSEVLALMVLIASLGACGSPGSRDLEFAYIGPGAGFAFLGSFLSLLSGLAMTVASLLMLPFRVAWRVLRRRQGFRKARVRRIIFLGLDGLDPRLTERVMAEGKLPNLTKLRAQGSYHRLRTTFPALSPVAWSTFATGVNQQDTTFSIFSIGPEELYAGAVLRQGASTISNLNPVPCAFLSRPWVDAPEKQTFWKILGEQNISSTIIRVPITFPPDRFHGRMLAAMSTPDLRGTQGSFSHFSTRIEKAHYESGSHPRHRRRQPHGLAGRSG
jgi:hypothetical protein